MADVKRVYTFGNKEAEGNGKMRELLGGKGANLAEMNLIGIPVPPGFTITTEVCAEYYKEGKERVIELLRPEVEAAIKNIENLTGRKFGDSNLPLLVSVNVVAVGNHFGAQLWVERAQSINVYTATFHHIKVYAVDVGQNKTFHFRAL